MNADTIPDAEIQTLIAGRTGKIRAACPLCAKGNDDTALDIDVEADGTGVYHCHRCEATGQINSRSTHLSGSKLSKPEYLYNSASDVISGHPYLAEKGIKVPPGIRLDDYGNLIIPLYNSAGNIQTVQMIRAKSENGKPRKFLSGKDRAGNKFPKKGASFRIGNTQDSEVIYFCEGFANAASLYESGFSPAVMTVDAGNIAPVLLSYRTKYPDRKFIIVADNDRNRPESASDFDAGFRKAAAAARKIGNTLVCLPEEPGQDINDIYKSAGPEGVKTLIITATAPDQQQIDLPERFQQIVFDIAGNDAESQRKIAQAIKKTLKNVKSRPKTADAIAMLETAGWKFELRECDDRVLCNGQPISDRDTARIYNWVRDNYLKLNVNEVDSVISEAADQNAFHPVKRYLESLKWDGGQHIDTLLSKLRTDDPEIIYPDGRRARSIDVYLKKWLVGAVSKVYRQTQNPALVLAGEQGRGKSCLSKWLCSGIPEYFIESPLTGKSVDMNLFLITKFVWEISELDATTRKADVSAVKAFITKGIVDERFSYRKHPVMKSAMASFIGTVNNTTGFLADQTGNRRFMCVNLTGIDFDYKKLNVNQLWAEAYHLFQSGFDFELDATEKAYQSENNKQYEQETPLEGLIDLHFEVTGESSDFMTSGQIVATLAEKTGIHLQPGPKTSADIKGVLSKIEGITYGRSQKVRGYRGIRQIAGDDRNHCRNQWNQCGYHSIQVSGSDKDNVKTYSYDYNTIDTIENDNLFEKQNQNNFGSNNNKDEKTFKKFSNSVVPVVPVVPVVDNIPESKDKIADTNGKNGNGSNGSNGSNGIGSGSIERRSCKNCRYKKPTLCLLKVRDFPVGWDHDLTACTSWKAAEKIFGASDISGSEALL